MDEDEGVDVMEGRPGETGAMGRDLRDSFQGVRMRRGVGKKEKEEEEEGGGEEEPTGIFDEFFDSLVL